MNCVRIPLWMSLALGSSVTSQDTTAVGLRSIGPGGEAPLIQFRDVTLEAGLLSTFTQGNSHTGGVAWVDYNGDYLPDLFVTNGGGLQHFLYRNEGGGLFSDVSCLVSKPDIALEDAGVKYADIDSDGDPDILVIVDNPAPLVSGQPVNPPEGGPNLLYLNNGDGTFSEVGAGYGVQHPLGRRTSCAGFADYDNDGAIDLYLGSWTMYLLPLGVHDDFDRLLHNNGDGTFADVTAQTGTDGYGLDALVLQWIDSDFDLFPDIYVGNVAHISAPPLFNPTDVHYRNVGGQSFYDDIPNRPGLGDDSWASMGMTVGDIENDGDWDLYITDVYMNPPTPLGNVLYLGSPDGSFSDNVADLYGVSSEDSWGCGFIDLDRDKWVDLWVGTMNFNDADRVFLNDRQGSFNQVSVAGFQVAKSRGGASADYDGDGDLDLFIVNDQTDSRLYRNESAVAGGWIQFKLFGAQTNRGAIGAVLRLTSGGVTQMRRISGGDSAHSQSEDIVHFGTGSDALVDLSIQWPSGNLQTFDDLAVGDIVFIDESAGILPETLVDGGWSWDETTRTLNLSVRSSFGGRSDLHAEGLGPLSFDASQGSYIGFFRCPSGCPGGVSVTSQRNARLEFALSPLRGRASGPAPQISGPRE